MIYDKLSQLDRYRGFSRHVDRGIAFLQMADLSALPLGRVDIDGDFVFGNRFSYTTAPISRQSSFEAHKRYLDLHVLLSGAETMALSPIELLEETEVLEQENSILYRGSPDCILPVRQGMFVLVFPGEGHLPRLAVGVPEKVEKLVLKIAL